MNLYRNGPAEVLKSLNNSIIEYIKLGKDDLDLTINAIVIGSLISLSVVSSIALVLVLSLIYYIDLKRKKFWQVVLQVPEQMLAELSATSKERLFTYHDEDVTREHQSDAARYT